MDILNSLENEHPDINGKTTLKEVFCPDALPVVYQEEKNVYKCVFGEFGHDHMYVHT